MKNAKTILFASLIAAMILPFSGMQFAAAETNNNNSENNKIPDNRIIERLGHNWESQY